ncbi:putative DNA-binding protein [Pacificibacter maritimus]|uniref:Putative DNA-binding protein n=1 Tax=Pacificibacter maritimus TaxID=762213 RepID=A0A3N4VB06_9RHOB|nr:DNA-binding domain-containing protein [Pacificibacter maritimus]RPE71000.1 putative DNA-binding protein [Pacificibacter maritimus]
MTQTISQKQFISAAMDPNKPVPQGIVGPDGGAAPKRFAVYQNNIMVGLKAAMQDGFPAVESLVGKDFFAAMTDIYIRKTPPRSPILALYGAEFAQFIAQFQPAAGLPYLAEVATLEYALRRSYHAADAAPIAAESFENPNVFSARVQFAPAMLVLRFKFPACDIRRAALGGPKPTAQAQDVIITRPDLDPIATAFPSGTAKIIEALQAGMPLGEAIEVAPDSLDLTTFISTLISGAAITKLEYDHV